MKKPLQRRQHRPPRRLPIAVLAAMCSLPGQASESTDLSVTGTILPPPCSLSLDRSTINLGDISAATLAPLTRNGGHAVARFGFNIECRRATRVRVRFKDNREDSVPAFHHEWARSNQNNPGHGKPMMFGLGKVDGKRIGSYFLYFDRESLMSGSFPISPVYGDGHDRQRAQPGKFLEDYRFIPTSVPLGWSADGEEHSGNFDHIHGQIVLSYMLESPEDLPLERDISLDGSATIDLEY